MLTSQWQNNQDPDKAELQTDDNRFVYDGKFVANTKLLGNWTAIDVVASIDEFTPDKTMDARRASIKGLTLNDRGLTNSNTLMWSGEILMDLDRYQALKLILKTIDGAEYLFVESGGFSQNNPVGWKTPLIVMKRK